MKYFESKKNFYLNKTFPTVQGYGMKVVRYNGSNDVDVQFEDGYILTTNTSSIKKGKVKNPYHPSVFGIGYLGVGKYNSVDNLNIYVVWKNMIGRCYDEKLQNKHKTYVNCSVVEEWHCFQNYAQWFENKHKSHMQGWHVDKDILIKGNKIYSPDTCCFVPVEINKLFVKANLIRGKYPIGVSKDKKLISIGKFIKTLGRYKTPEEAFYVYKEAKEIHIKTTADYWVTLIEPETYQAMYSYQVEITD